MVTHSSTLAWKIPWTEEPSRLQSMGSQRVRHNLMTKQQLLKRRVSRDLVILIFLVQRRYWCGAKSLSVQFGSVQSLSRVWLFATPWIAARQASLSISRVQLFVTPRTVTHLAPLSTGFPRQEYCSGLPFPPWGSSHPGTEPRSLMSLLLAGEFFATKRHVGRHDNPLQYSCLENPMDCP